MDNHFDINILLQKPIAMMTGEELIFLHYCPVKNGNWSLK